MMCETHPPRRLYNTLSKTPRPVGFQNIGATCWLNTLLQLLLSLSAFNDAMINVYAGVKSCPPHSIATIYYSIIDNIERGTTAKKTAPVEQASQVILSALTERLERNKIKPNFGNYHSCSEEGLCYLLDVIDNLTVKKVFQNAYSLTIICPSCNRTVSRVRDQAFTIRLHHESMFPAITLLLARFRIDSITAIDSATPSIATMIEFVKEINSESADLAFLKSDATGGEKVRHILDSIFNDFIVSHYSPVDKYKCAHCKVTSRNLKRYEQLRLINEVVIIQLDKYRGKTNQYFPQKLKIPSFNNKDLYYELVAVAEHFGVSNQSGHYTARVRRNGAWYNINDSTVTPSSAPSPTPEAFLLAYHLTAFK